MYRMEKEKDGDQVHRNQNPMTTEIESKKVTNAENSLGDCFTQKNEIENPDSRISDITTDIDAVNNPPEKEAKPGISESLCEEEMYKEINDDGWEDILGSGRLKKRIMKEGKKGLATEGLGRPSRNDHVTVSLKGNCKIVPYIGQHNRITGGGGGGGPKIVTLYFP